jgi:hypothetical protein
MEEHYGGERMKTSLVVLLPLITLVCSSEPEQGGLPESFKSGAALTEMCGDAVLLVEGDTWEDDVPIVSTVKISWCAGYVVGLKDVVADVSAQAGLFCVPTPVTSWQLIEPIVQYATEHPESQGLHRSALAIQAWSAAFPCSREAPLAQPRLLG